MTDRVYPSAKPNPPPAAVNGGGGAPTKTTQLYDPNRPRPVYRQQQNRRTRSCSCRKCCCLTFLYTLITLLILILLAAIGACIFYVLYHPKHPTFAVTSVRTGRFNLTQPDPSGFAHLTSRFDFTITAKNPNNKKITFVYNPMVISVTTAGVDSGNATLTGFTHAAGNTTVLRATVASDAAKDLDSDSVSELRSELGKKKGFPVTVVVNTMVEVQMGKIKTKKVGVRVTCQGIKGFPPKNATSKVGTLGTTSSNKCKVDLRIKIWKFTF
ncbi:hypothetical protein RND81_10G171400 [Saponaria officinalis]|uniref:Late embryogenesis abundant protein LEA-2 subgroup domain-containing protein n=1 Tax=Saponaria officinalis TaxID=3572 RepID=A0AAW1I5L2_SAPOF